MEYEKKGYLTSYFKLFRLKDIAKLNVKAHYHEFDKIILFLSGKVNYVIEAQSYQLFPYDIVFVPHNSVHYPVIDEHAPYERLVIYISPAFLEKESDAESNLAHCFFYARQNHSYVMHLDNIETNDIVLQMNKLENSFTDGGFANKIYTKLIFMEFMILLNRAIINDNCNINTHHHVSYDENVLAVLDYINRNLFNELNVDQIAKQFFVSKYYLMRRFKAKTGYSIHQYILNKRLLAAKEYIKNGRALTQVCFDCGFKDYSVFSRSFKAAFRQSPREFKKSIATTSNDYKEVRIND
ncbi:AraC family transcriptional regulator [Megamonas hypermegale]|uniref:AraC family transcriptional regulator n=1 Tax=Megamonas hypermegale TaxID=158847 RepID=UPI0025A35781|nr:AraC family transcriptional regulator [Megamonas hypermegale]MDM8142821.1 AraC family transcriptional regulator [Megamonas hypermegale]